ncbi:lipopolysaccharide core heptose(II) kinase RfaY [Mahella sp.]|uniref:ABC1 kinase family protein n=1 Tax=Mahella sp. TaxID=2798721 RepID=UPI0025C19453|nr:lipopolysaccharide core heptose(II) kinase RfaY [Mahella sp.]MBZ4665324.1 hypothetical protein [Mahella sp.]MDK2903878.1 ubiquinone biosynthesis protein [Clostridiales bacterium]
MKNPLGKQYRRWHRYAEIANVLFKYGFGFIADRIGITNILFNIQNRVKGAKVSTLSGPQRVRLMLEEMGPLFMKLGQILSVRPDLIPQEYIRELSKLQDAGPELPFDMIKAAIEREIGSSIDDVFTYIDPRPIAAASIAQVHKAVLKNDGEAIIKIQRPEIDDIVEDDLAILKEIAGLMEARMPESRRYQPMGIVNELSRSIRRELDFVREGMSIDHFRRNFEGHTEIYVPRVFWEYTTKHMLVMEYIDGVKVNEIEKIDAMGLDRKTIAENGARAIMKQIFEDGFFHADPHPGNIFIMRDGRIAFIDFGMMGRLTKEDQDHVVDLISAVINRDVNNIIKAFFNIGVLSKDVDLRGFYIDVTELLEKYYEKTLAEINMGELVNETVSMAFRYGIGLPSQFTLLDKSLMTIEGVAKQLYPEVNVFELARPFVTNMMRKRHFSKEAVKARLDEIYDSADSLFKISPVALDVLNKLSKGEAEVKFQLEGLDKAVSRFNRMVNRLINALIISAVIIGSAVIVGVEGSSIHVPLSTIGTVGFIAAGVAGIWLLIDILRSGHM